MEIKHVYKTIRASAILTNAYVAGTVLGGNGGSSNGEPVEYSQIILYVGFTKGSLTSASVKIEYSEDGTNYFQETFKSVSGGESTETLGVHIIPATGNYTIPVAINHRYIKVSSIGTGTVTGSALSVSAVLATN
jgi:hypothetical protein